MSNHATKIAVRGFALVLAASAAGLGPAPLGGQTVPARGDALVREYKIGAKDLLEITVFELPELNQTVRVSEDGSISLPLLGRVEIEGLTREEVEKRIASLLFEKDYVKAPRVTVFIREYQSKRVAVIGAVANPGTFELVGRQTLLQILSAAGGLTDKAAREILIFREEGEGRSQRLTIDVADLIDRGNMSLNVPLQANDVINVPADEVIQIYVYGQVRNPGALEVKRSKRIDIQQAIAQAGGLTEGAARARITVTRRGPGTDRETKIRVNLNDIIKGKKPTLLLEEGDVVFVPESIF